MNIDKRLEKSIKRIRASTLDVRELPDTVGFGDPKITADQLDRESDELDKIHEILVTGRGTGNE